MIEPDPCFTITFAASFAHRYALVTFISSVAINSETSPSGIYVGSAAPPPALHTITSSLPCRSTILSTIAATSSRSVASHPIPSIFRPSADISAATCSQSSFRRLAITTVAPSSASAVAIARPRCVPPPVTTATRPVISNCSEIFIVRTCTQTRSSRSAPRRRPRTLA